MKLIGSLTSPYVRKVRVTLIEKGIECPLLLEDVWAADPRIQLFNPLGKVPCLLLDDGSALYDSRVICEYLDSLAAGTQLIPRAGAERIAVRRWEALADGVLDAIVLVRLETTQREAQQRNQSWVDRQLAKVHAGLAAAAEQLGYTTWCVGDHLTLADIAVGCALSYLQFRYPDIVWQTEYRNLADYYRKLSGRRAFAETVPPT